jgi:nitrate reductase gamma subunit
MTSCLGRFLRGRRPDRNPVRRTTDRMETVILAMLLAVFCAGAPFLAIAAADTTHMVSMREIRAQVASYHKTTAVLLDAPVGMDAYPVFTAPQADARWTAPDGRTVTGLVTAPAADRAGSKVQVLTDQSGNLAAPMEPAEVATRETLGGIAAVAGLASAVLLIGSACRRELTRRRMTAWETDWLTTEPRWTSHH